MKPTTVLVVLDGWGHREETAFNAIHHASTPTWDRLWRDHPRALLECSGEHVGLPAGQMGNSEVGHITMGAGRVVRQELSRIDHAIEDGSFAQNDALTSLMHNGNDGTLHVFGLLSPGGVHSHENHIFAAIELAREADRKVALHAFLDGRDTPPKSAESSLRLLSHLLGDSPRLQLASISGRYYAMDRDRRWERTQIAFDLYVNGTCEHQADTGVQALIDAYERNETDEFVAPTQVGRGAVVKDGDDVLFMNFRADRARQLCRAFVVDDGAVQFPRSGRTNLNHFVCLTPYAEDIDAGGSHVDQVSVAFKPEDVTDTFGQVVASSGKTQLRIAETEKYAHVTYFFSGGSEAQVTGETRRFHPSPKVATYDLQPEMSAEAVANEVATAVLESRYDSIICNFANADMVGHTGNFPAAIRAVECLDTCLATVTAATLQTDSHCLITADHGNVEEMVQRNSEQPHTAHTIGLVPCVYIGRDNRKLMPNGGLQDIAPTMLDLMGLDQPQAMTGHSLLN